MIQLQKMFEKFIQEKSGWNIQQKKNLLHSKHCKRYSQSYYF